MQMNFETEKAWMVRSDGVAFPCICHIYGSKDDIEETLYAAQWLYGHTANAKTKDLCLRLFKTYGISLSEHRNCVRSILLQIKKTPYRFLNYDFVLLARYENEVGRIIKNALLMMIAYFPRSLCILAILLSPIALMTLSDYFLFFWFLYGFSFPGYVNAMLFGGLLLKTEEMSSN